jgi:hypothetical protein
MKLLDYQLAKIANNAKDLYELKRDIRRFLTASGWTEPANAQTSGMQWTKGELTAFLAHKRTLRADLSESRIWIVRVISERLQVLTEIECPHILARG